jgi:hypothetical protein
MTTIPKIPITRSAADPRTNFSPAEIKALDASMRVIALEEVADLRVRAWPRSKIGLLAATQHFLDQGVRLHKNWVSDKPSGVVNSIIAKSIALLGEADGKELANEVISGLSLSSHPRGEAGSAAAAVKREILNGQDTNHWKANILRHTQQRANSVLKRRNVRLRTHGPGRGSISVSPKGEENEAHEVSSFDTITKDPEVLSADPMIKRWVEDRIEDMPVRPGSEWHTDAAYAWVADPDRHGILKELGEQYDVNPNAVKKVIVKLMKHLGDSLDRDRKMKKHFDLLLNRADFGRRASDVEIEEFSSKCAAFVDHLSRCAGLQPSTARLAQRYLKAAHPLLRKVRQIMEAEDLYEDDDWRIRDGYVGRGMVGLPGTPDRVSPLAISVDSRYLGPRSDIGQALDDLGFSADNMGMGWIYYLRS